jgi:hypothetical protein
LRAPGEQLMWKVGPSASGNSMMGAIMFSDLGSYMRKKCDFTCCFSLVALRRTRSIVRCGRPISAQRPRVWRPRPLGNLAPRGNTIWLCIVWELRYVNITCDAGGSSRCRPLCLAVSDEPSATKLGCNFVLGTDLVRTDVAGGKCGRARG